MVTGIQRRILFSLSQFLRLCRAVYCWIFAFLAFSSIGALASTIRELMQEHSIEKGNIASVALPSFYTVIFVIAWTIFRHKRSSKVWGIAASCLMAAPFLPFLAIGAWQVFWDDQKGWLPFMPFGMLGIVAFSVPHHREKLTPQKDEMLIDGEPTSHHRSVAHLALDIGRSIYGWAFFANACFSVYWLGIEGLRAIVKHSGIPSDFAFGAPYAAVFGLASWMIFRGKSASNKWAIAANCLVVVPHLVFLPFGYWRAVWWFKGAEPFPYMPFGILGILLFSLPYLRKRRLQPRTSAESPAEQF
jgi:hypothetical protein